MNAEGGCLRPDILQNNVKTFPTDSREVKAGDVFFAFSQPEFKNNGFNGNFVDAHKFVPSAFEKGAVACVVRQDRFREHEKSLKTFKDRLIFSDDVIAAFQNLAHCVYLNWNGPVVGVTGSAGKTTAKKLIAHILESSGRKVLSNIKNLNNGIGHPVTVLKLVGDKSFDIAVLEMGMSTPMNEIRRLCQITPPDVGVELNVLSVHVEHLGAIENVAKAKAELIEGLKESGTAILNVDDFRVAKMASIHKGRVITYGIEKEADIMALGIKMKRFGETCFTLKTPDGGEEVVFSLSGKHNVLNALAASAVGYNFGMTAFEISQALRTVTPPSQRGEVLHFRDGFTVINDSYNSNPVALLEMVKTLNDGATDKNRKIVIAGEMLELGNEEQQIHQATGRKLAAAGIDYLIGVRGLAKYLIESAKDAGLKKAMFFESSDEAGRFFTEEVRGNDVVLVKGSRSVQTEHIVERLLENYQISKRLQGDSKSLSPKS